MFIRVLSAGNLTVAFQTRSLTEETPIMTDRSLREAQTEKYPRIHHYCWYGRPVFHSVRTPPEESLAVIHAEPKYPSGSAKYRITSILNRAMKLVEPVIVNIDRFDYDLWDQSGSDLIKSVNGRVRKLYSPHGQWMKIGLGNDFAIVDLTETERWDSSKVLFGNGLYDNDPIPTWDDCIIWQQGLAS